MKTKRIAKFLIILSILLCIIQIRGCISVHNLYDKNAFGYWKLAERNLSLIEKSNYVDEFIDALIVLKHSDYNAIIYKTPNVKFEDNIRILKSLKYRLDLIKFMDFRAFVCHDTIRQITMQEWNSTREILYIFKGCFILENCWYAWNWLAAVFCIMYLLMMFIGIFIIKRVNKDE